MRDAMVDGEPDRVNRSESVDFLVLDTNMKEMDGRATSGTLFLARDFLVQYQPSWTEDSQSYSDSPLGNDAESCCFAAR